MTKRVLLGVFDNEETVVVATRSSREAGYPIHDVFTPYPVHGLDAAMGLRPSRLPWLCLGFAVSGLCLAALGEFWMGSIDWPLNIGGKPWNSLPAYLPIMFELTVLAGGVGTVLGLLAIAGLYPGSKKWVPNHRVTSSQFVLALDAADPAFDADAATLLLRRFDVSEVTMHQEKES